MNTELLWKLMKEGGKGLNWKLLKGESDVGRARVGFSLARLASSAARTVLVYYTVSP